MLVGKRADKLTLGGQKTQVRSRFKHSGHVRYLKVSLQLYCCIWLHPMKSRAFPGLTSLACLLVCLQLFHDSVGKFCTDKRTRRKKNLLKEYERHEKQLESHFLLDEDADSRLSCLFR